MHTSATTRAAHAPPPPRRRKLITEAARELERSKMARFDERSGNLYVTGMPVYSAWRNAAAMVVGREVAWTGRWSRG